MFSFAPHQSASVCDLTPGNHSDAFASVANMVGTDLYQAREYIVRDAVNRRPPPVRVGRVELPGGMRPRVEHWGPGFRGNQPLKLLAEQKLAQLGILQVYRLDWNDARQEFTARDTRGAVNMMSVVLGADGGSTSFANAHSLVTVTGGRPPRTPMFRMTVASGGARGAPRARSRRALTSGSTSTPRKRARNTPTPVRKRGKPAKTSKASKSAKTSRKRAKRKGKQ